ncbi:MAG: glycosyltransferase family 2 protein [Planctomycetota bacterium]
MSSASESDSASRLGQDPERPFAAGIGMVVIGRNEGERLRRCLTSLGELVAQAVYVDSGSTDGSVAMAQQMGATVVELDTNRPFTAARARNAGFAKLVSNREVAQPIEHVQFVDGDCEVESNWLQVAAAALAAEPELAVVFGRRRERHPERTPYNQLCDLEWDVPVGDVLSCGGDAMMRVAAFQQVGGFDEARIAGEEPELCLRLRASGHRIRRIDAPMTVHDADMHRLSQWWQRAVRAGYVEAEGVAEHGKKYPRWKSALSTLVWALALPAAAGTAGFFVGWLWGWPYAALVAVLLLLCYLRLYRRIQQRASQRWAEPHAHLYARFCTLGKWPQAQGMFVYWWRRLMRRDRTLIEYKQAATR